MTFLHCLMLSKQNTSAAKEPELRVKRSIIPISQHLVQNTMTYIHMDHTMFEEEYDKEMSKQN